MRRFCSFVFLTLVVCAAAAAQEISFTLPSRSGAFDGPRIEPKLLAAGLAAPAPSGTCSEVEPNEQFSQATPISIPSSCTGSAASTDSHGVNIKYGDGTNDGVEDLWVLNLAAAAQPTIELTYSNSSADFDLFLFTVSGTTIKMVAQANHEAIGQSEKIAMQYPLAAGTYYIGVSAYSGSSAYTLTTSAPGFSQSCTPTATALCLNNGRFRVEADWATADNSGKGTGVLLTSETGWFWFFGETNVEIVVKLLDACSLNNTFWVFSGGLTDVQVTLKVTDTLTGATKQYVNPRGTPYKIITDTGAFSTCNPNCTYSVSPSSQSFTASGGSGSVAVTAGAGCPWNASSGVSWITINSGSSGSGNGSVSYSVSSNSSSSSRTGTLSIAGKSVSITQAGATASCTYSVSPSSQNFSSTGGTGSVSVTAGSGCSWTAAANDSWITISSGSSGSGNGSVSYSVAANGGSSSRTGSMTIAGKTVTITQDVAAAACTVSLSMSQKSMTWCGGDVTYVVDTQDSCTFNITSDSSWIQPVLIRGKGKETASFIVAANTSSSSRQGVVNVNGQTITVDQSGKSGNGQYDGLYSGKTGANRDVTACVASNAVQALHMQVSFNFFTSTCTTYLVATTPLPISGSSFTGTIMAWPEIAPSINTKLTGSFPSSSSMSGSWTEYSGSYLVYCGSSLYLGFGTPLPAGTFTATKQ